MSATLTTPTLGELSTKINDLTGKLESLHTSNAGKKFDEATEGEWKNLSKQIDESVAEYSILSSREAALGKYQQIREKHAGKSAINIQHDTIVAHDRTPGSGPIPESFRKAFSPGEALIESNEFKELLERFSIKQYGDVPSGTAMEMKRAIIEGASFKDLLTTGGASGGALYRPARLDGIQEILRPAMRVTDLLPAIPVASNAIEYVRQSLRTNNAAVVPEAVTTADAGNLKPESALGFTVITDSLETIAHMLPATRQILADAPQLRAFIDAFLRQGLMEKLEANVIAGILAASGLLVQAKGTNTLLDTLMMGATKVTVEGFTRPQSYLLHPYDWQRIRLTKDAQGQYLMGPASVQGAVTVWGLPVVDSQYATEGVGLVADWNTLGAIYEREQIQTYVTDSHADWFRRNLIAILMEMRAKLAIYRAASGCKMTGLNA